MVISGLELLKPPLSSIDSDQKHLHGLVGDKLFSTLQPVTNRWNVTSLSLYYYFHNKYSDQLDFFFSTVQIFTTETCHVHTQGGIPSFSLYSIVKKSVSSQELLLYAADIQEDASPITTILTSLSLGLSVIYPTYSYNYSLLPPLIFIKQPHSVPLCLERLLNLVLVENLVKRNMTVHRDRYEQTV